MKQLTTLDAFLATLRRYPFPVRARHLESFASFESRVQEANFADALQKNTILRDARASLPGERPAALWEAIVAARAGLRADHFSEEAVRELSHPDGSMCGGCRVGTGDQWMCRLCAHGQRIKLRAHLDYVVCARHRLWVGSGTQPEDQWQVADEFVEAERSLQKLRRKGVVDAATLWELLHVVSPHLTDEAEHHLMPPEPFPLAMRIWTVLASTHFQRKFFNPNRTYAESFAYLGESLSPFTADGDLVRRVWHYLRPTSLSVREWVIAGGELAPHWEHDFAIDPRVVKEWDIPIRPLEPFSRYLAAGGVTAITAENWREVLVHRNAGHGKNYLWRKGHTTVAGVCVNGHRTGVQAFVVVRNRDNYMCAYCDGRKALAGENDITVTHPARAAYFDVEVNGAVKPTDYVATSPRQLAWQCPRGHKYTRSVRGQCSSVEPCRVCENWELDPETNSVAALAPDLVAQWHPTLNDRSPREVKVCASEFAWFQCAEGHPPQRSNVLSRVNGRGCRGCGYAKVADLLTQFVADIRPELEAEWDPALNDGLTFVELRGSRTVERAWRCARGHITYKTTGKRLVSGCGVCTGHLRTVDVNPAAKYPLITSEWDEQLNGIPASEARVDVRYLWRCVLHGHIENVALHRRRANLGCTRCSRPERIAYGREKGTY